MPVDLAEIYADCGVDIFEAGVPCRDPFMDGELVKSSMRRSIEHGTTDSTTTRALETLRKQFPSHYITAMGYGDLTQLVHDTAGEILVDGILQIGTGHDENANCDQIGFVSDRVTQDEVDQAKHASGYIMLQANEGKTGIREFLPPENAKRIQRVRDSGMNLPILLGIGVSTPQQVAEAISLGADGVIIGSACLVAAENGEIALRRFLRNIRGALDDA